MKSVKVKISQDAAHFIFQPYSDEIGLKLLENLQLFGVINNVNVYTPVSEDPALSE